jgi:serine/threonine-protein kinase
MAAILLKSRYRVLRELANGRFGKTFLAEDTQMPSGKKCVIKQLKPIDDNPQIHQLVRERFQREAAILETLGDNNRQIPRLYAYFAEAGEFYLVQEWIQGQTLGDRVQQVGLFSEQTVKEILLDILPVLQDIHSQGIIHRDIKPDNIILRSLDGKPVLIDFGVVKEIMGITVTADGRAKSAIVVGTPGFIPSEQAAGRPLFASDLYALGLTAIYLLTGKMPEELKTNPLTGEILWRQHALNVSPSFAAILEKTIHPSARDRYMNAPAMLAALQQLDTHTTPPPPIVPPQPQSPPPAPPTPVPPTIVPEFSPPPPRVISPPTHKVGGDETFNPPVPAGKVASETLNPPVSTSKVASGEPFKTAVSTGRLAGTLAKAALIFVSSLVALAVLVVAIGYITKPKSNHNSPVTPTEQNNELSPSTSRPTEQNGKPSASTSQPEPTTKNSFGQVKIDRLETYTYSANLFSIKIPRNWQRRDRSTTGEAIVGWYDPTENAFVAVDVFSREAFQQTGEIPQDRLSRFLVKAAQQQYRAQPNFQLGATETVNSGWLQIDWSYTVANKQGEKGRMLGYGFVRQDDDKISYIHFVVPEAQYPQLRSQIGKITTSYSINPTAPLP